MHFQTERHLNNRRSSGKHSPSQSAGPTLWRARRNAIFLDWDTDARTDDKRERAKRTSPGLGRSARALFHHEAKTPCETNPKAQRKHESFIAGKSFVPVPKHACDRCSRRDVCSKHPPRKLSGTAEIAVSERSIS